MMTMMQRQGNQVAKKLLWKGRGERRGEIGEPGIVFQAQKWGDGMSGGGRERDVRLAQAEGLPPTYWVFYVSVSVLPVCL